MGYIWPQQKEYGLYLWPRDLVLIEYLAMYGPWRRIHLLHMAMIWAWACIWGGHTGELESVQIFIHFGPGWSKYIQIETKNVKCAELHMSVPCFLHALI